MLARLCLIMQYINYGIFFMTKMLRGGANNTTVPSMSFSSNYCLLPYVSYTRSAYNKDELKVIWVFMFFPSLFIFIYTSS